MTRYHVDTNAETGVTTARPYTPEEEAAADALVNPSSNPADYDLFDWQLRKGLIANGYSISAIEAAILEIEDQAERETRWLYWDRPTTIRWASPATQEFIAWLGIPQVYAADMWLAAKDYTL